MSMSLALKRTRAYRPLTSLRLNPNTWQADNLLSCWNVSNNRSLSRGIKLFDISFNGRHGDLINGGIWSDGLVLDGSDDFVDFGTNIPFTNNSFTMWLDVTFRPGYETGFHRYFSYYDPTFWSQSGAFSIVHAGTIDFSTGWSIQSYKRTQLALVSGSDNRCYQDGVLTNTAASVTWTKAGNVYLGRGNSFSEQAPMEIHEARIYDRPLSQAEIAQLSNPQTRFDLFLPIGEIAGFNSQQIFVGDFFSQQLF
jgi:Concanavalin A-like lectin/glucanases superfamily